jgi:7-carboxy-7-deazaguanine synthase
MFDAVGELTAGLRAAGLHVTIETAGTIFREAACDLMSISPKLASSTPREGDARDPLGVWRARHEERRLNLDALQRLIDASPERQLKFVVCRREDLGEIEAVLAQLRGWSPGDVQLMPEGTAVPDPASVAWVVQACVERGWRYCHRLHVELFGNRRGT